MQGQPILKVNRLKGFMTLKKKFKNSIVGVILKNNDEKRGLAFIAPLVILMVLLYIWPMVQSIIISFQDKNGNWGILNYKNLFTDHFFVQSLNNTVIFTIVSVFFHLVVGLAIALLLNLKVKPWFVNIIKGIAMIPWLISVSVAGAVWVLLYHPVGVFNYYLLKLGIISSQISWIGDPKFALMALALVNIWKFYPLYMIMIYAGLKSIPEEIYESARVDGAKAYQLLIHITIPQIKGVLVFTTLLNTIWTLRHFAFPYIMTQGGPMFKTMLLTNYVYDTAFRNLQINYGSAITVFMLVVSLVFCFIYLKLFQRSE